MQGSFSKAAAGGLYRSACCQHVVEMALGRMLPLCPRCRETAAWGLAQPFRRPALPSSDSTQVSIATVEGMPTVPAASATT
jgi:hypothetical protein